MNTVKMQMSKKYHVKWATKEENTRKDLQALIPDLKTMQYEMETQKTFHLHASGSKMSPSQSA